MPLIWVKIVKESLPRNWDRLFAKAGQWHMKCSNDSSSSMHALQTLWFTEPILCRCARKPVCPVRMPITLLISLLVSFSNVLVLSSLGSPHRIFVVSHTFPLFHSVVWACLDYVINSDRVAPKGFDFPGLFPAILWLLSPDHLIFHYLLHRDDLVPIWCVFCHVPSKS